MPRKKVKKGDASGSAGMGDFGSAIAQICEEKGISKDKVIETISAALAAAYKKDYGKKGQNIRADFNEVSGETKFFLVKEVVNETMREFPTEEEDIKAEDEKKENKKERENVSRETFLENGEEKLPRFNPLKYWSIRPETV